MKKRTRALVVGSVVYDEICLVHGDLRNEISLENGEVSAINFMLTAKNKKRYFGGTAGNIAYGLGKAGTRPLIFSCVGEDFAPSYQKQLQKNNVDSRVFNAGGGQYTATFYSFSDEAGQQIGVFQPNAYGSHVHQVPLAETLSDDDFSEVKVAIMAPGTGQSTLKHLNEVVEKTQGEATTILDPGQELSTSFNREILMQVLPLSNIVIGNEVEISQLRALHGLSVSDIFAHGPKAVIETKGDKGAVLHTPQRMMDIHPARPSRVVEATGAGDAFRAGLIKGLLDGRSLEESANLGAKLGALSVQEFGGQGYEI